MKVYMNGYPNHWLSPYTILEKVYFWREIDYDEPNIKKWSKILTPFCEALQRVRQVINPTIRYVKIDYTDTYSLDYTLAYIICPLLKQMKAVKHGYGWVDDEDVPEELRSYNGTKDDEYSWDSNAEARYDWIIDEMIWAFEQKINDDDEKPFFDHSESEGIADFNESIKKIKVDREGLKAHQDRKSNGYRLFGKYYESLWT